MTRHLVSTDFVTFIRSTSTKIRVNEFWISSEKSFPFIVELIVILWFTITNGFPSVRLFAIKPFGKHNLNTWRFKRNNSAGPPLYLSRRCYRIKHNERWYVLNRTIKDVLDRNTLRTPSETIIVLRNDNDITRVTLWETRFVSYFKD